MGAMSRHTKIFFGLVIVILLGGLVIGLPLAIGTPSPSPPCAPGLKEEVERLRKELAARQAAQDQQSGAIDQLNVEVATIAERMKDQERALDKVLACLQAASALLGDYDKKSLPERKP